MTLDMTMSSDGCNQELTEFVLEYLDALSQVIPTSTFRASHVPAKLISPNVLERHGDWLAWAADPSEVPQEPAANQELLGDLLRTANSDLQHAHAFVTRWGLPVFETIGPAKRHNHPALGLRTSARWRLLDDGWSTPEVAKELVGLDPDPVPALQRWEELWDQRGSETDLAGVIALEEIRHAAMQLGCHLFAAIASRDGELTKARRWLRKSSGSWITASYGSPDQTRFVHLLDYDEGDLTQFCFESLETVIAAFANSPGANHLVVRARPAGEIEHLPRTSYGVAAIQTAQIAAGAPLHASCSECGSIYQPSRRPPKNRRRYCPRCRELGEAQRHASAAYRSRQKSAR